MSVIFGLLACGATAYRDAALADSDDIRFLLAEELLQKPWPLNSDLNSDLTPLETGNWVVLCVRQECELCHELIDEHFADPSTTRSNERTAMFTAGADSWPFAIDRVAIDYEPDGTINWPHGEPFISSPAAFILREGKVVEAADGKNAIELIAKLF
ncbi:hypothetical protein [Roseimaritima sediminicola]|uniref:hypothetical protein n=1 Tax=Roseimaritima sediminicola TaxID=2662066 RepID=UPI0012982DB9|nr:hypothetical protein [Roseimaritima sediminicola]